MVIFVDTDGFRMKARLHEDPACGDTAYLEHPTCVGIKFVVRMADIPADWVTSEFHEFPTRIVITVPAGVHTIAGDLAPAVAAYVECEWADRMADPYDGD